MDTFSLLEDKVRKAASLVRELRQRNQSLEQELPEVRKRAQRLEQELPELRTRVQDLQRALQAAERAPAAPSDDDTRKAAESARKLAATEQEVKTLRQEREEVRVRIARLMEVLDGLE
jgi:predicted  nucleic acid-binding Zn-ribbon protein